MLFLLAFREDILLVILWGILLTGDNWEHEEIFTDDDEAAGNDLEGWDAAEIPAPPEIKQVELVLMLQLFLELEKNDD